MNNKMIPYGSKNDLELLAGRVKKCTPGGEKLSDSEALALAQISLSTGFNPFIGEIWYVPGKGPMVGVRGFRNRAKSQSTYSLHLRAMTSEEITAHNVRPADVGRICELYRHDVLMKAVEINKAVGKVLIPIEPILGVGIWRKAYPDIGQYKDDPIPHGKSSVWIAEKRAEADALNKGFDITILPFDAMAEEQLLIANGDEIIEAEVVQREAIENAHRAAEEDITDLFGKEAAPEPPIAEEESATAVEEQKAKIPETAQVELPQVDTLLFLRTFAEKYSKQDKDLAPSGAQLKLLGALCSSLEQHGLPKNSLFTLRELTWGDEHFKRQHFQAILQTVCILDDNGNIQKGEGGSFLINEANITRLTSLLGAEIPADGDLPF